MQTTSTTRPISTHRPSCRNLTEEKTLSTSEPQGLQLNAAPLQTHLYNRGGHFFSVATESSAVTITYQTAAAPIAWPEGLPAGRRLRLKVRLLPNTASPSEMQFQSNKAQEISFTDLLRLYRLKMKAVERNKTLKSHLQPKLNKQALNED